MLTRNLNIVLVESDIAWADKAANLDQLQTVMRQLPPGTDLVVLPELFTTGFLTGDRDLAIGLAERNTGDTITQLHRLAAEYQVR